MKKTKRKLVYAFIILITIIIVTIFCNNGSSISSNISSPEALAAGEAGDYKCEDAPGFCIINGLPVNGVTYKE